MRVLPRAAQGLVETKQACICQAEAVGFTSDPPFPALPSFPVGLAPPSRLAGDSGILTT